MLIPINVDVPLERLPWTNWAIIALNLICFIALIFSEDKPQVLVLWRDDFHVIQLLGSVYGHADIIHLLGNMLFLFCFGNAVNARLGHAMYAVAYHALGIFSSLAWLAMGHGIALVGASGAIMGVVGMFIVFFPINDVKMFYWWGFFYFGTFDISAYWVIAAYFAFDMLGLALGGGAVAYIAHVAGGVAGAGLALWLLKLGMAKPGEFERNLLQVWSGDNGQSSVRTPAPMLPAATPAPRRRKPAAPVAANYAAPVAMPESLENVVAATEAAPVAVSAHRPTKPAAAFTPAPKPPPRPNEVTFTPAETPDPYDIK